MRDCRNFQARYEGSIPFTRFTTKHGDTQGKTADNPGQSKASRTTLAHKMPTINGHTPRWLLAAALLILGVLIYYAGGAEPAHASKRPVTTEYRKQVICQVFGRRHCADAIKVAWCESRLNTYASNGQFKGAFQMGRRERATYGHGAGMWRQARAARRYFIASGRDWSPWTCRRVL